jgi:hypothetical protein
LLSLHLTIFGCPIDFGRTDSLKRQRQSIFLFNGLIRSLDYFQLFQPCPVLHGSTKMPAQHRASTKCLAAPNYASSPNLKWERHCRDADA